MKAMKSEWQVKIRAGRRDALYGHASVAVAQQPYIPNGGLKWQAFVNVASELANAVSADDTEKVELRTYKEVGLTLAGKGFVKPLELHSFKPAEAKLFSRKLPVVSCLERVFARWQVSRQIRREERMKTLQQQIDSEAMAVCDGAAVADAIEDQAIGAGLEKHTVLSEQLGLPFTQEMPKPSEMMTKVKNGGVT